MMQAPPQRAPIASSHNLVDLTQMESSDDDSAIVTSPVAATVPSAGEPTSANDADDSEEEDELPLLYSLNQRDCSHLKIVGIRYYRGVAHAGEYVTLVREPANPYDRNAIRVDNLQGEKVGHVAKEAAAVLSPVWDRFPTLALDASIPWRGNHYMHPLQLDIRASEELFPRLKKVLRPIVPLRKEKETAVAEERTTVAVKRVDWKQQQAQLDALWKDMLQKQLEGLYDVPTPPALLSSLFPHQLDALRWLVHREQSNENPFYETATEHGRTVYLCKITQSSQQNAPAAVRGGILADDMGLGKTLQTIALILAQPPPGRDYPPGKYAPRMAISSTLNVDCRFNMNETNDISSTKEINGHAVRKKVHQRLPHSWGITKKADRQTLPITLIVAPVSVLSNWQEQIKTHVAPHTLRVALYQGPNRRDMLSRTDDFDIWITSFSTLQADFRPLDAADKAKHAGDAPTPAKRSRIGRTIFDVPFFRIILDEGHTIRNSKSSTFRACASLQGERRLCITGTPIANRPDDIQSLLQFLRVAPLSDKNIFRRAISQPIKDGDGIGLQNLRLSMAFTALRRSKQTIALPEKTVELRSVASAHDSRHQKVYETIYESARATLAAVLREPANDSLNSSQLSHASVFEVLTRLRQACCCATLVPKDRLLAAEQVLDVVRRKDTLTAEEGHDLLEKLKGVLENEDDETPECTICMEELLSEQAVVLRQCGHVFCNDCMTKTLKFKTACALCRKPFQQEDLIPYEKVVAATAEETAKPRSLLDDWETIGPSPKMDALLVALGEMQPDEKGVIYSQFTKFLDRLEDFLSRKGWSCVRIDGSKSRAKRAQAINEFGADDGPRLFLCSLHAAGTGINLTRGNHVFLMDPWWNKAVEAQAQDRIHRLGQTRACRVVRFVAAESVESRMVELQEAKAAIGKGAFESLSVDEKRKARMADLKKLLEL